MELKAKVLAACAEPGASISGVALAHGLNANLVRKWRSERGTKRGDTTITPATTSAALAGAAAEFVAVEMPALPRPAAARQPRGTVPIAGPVLVQEPAEPQIIAASGFAAHILISRFVDHLPY